MYIYTQVLDTGLIVLSVVVRPTRSQLLLGILDRRVRQCSPPSKHKVREYLMEERCSVLLWSSREYMTRSVEAVVEAHGGPIP